MTGNICHTSKKTYFCVPKITQNPYPTPMLPEYSYKLQIPLRSTLLSTTALHLSMLHAANKSYIQ